jgi:hypothetical protein
LGPRWFASLLLVAVAYAVPAVAQHSPAAESRRVLEEQIAAILSSKTVRLPALEAGGEARFETLPLTSPTSDRVLDETTAFFEKCVLVVRLVQHHPLDWRQMDTRLDISLIVAEPERVKIRPRSVHPQLGPMGGSIIYRWRPEVERRMKVLQRQAREILDEAMERFPADVETRLAWIAARHDKELVDKIYLDAGRRVYYDNGVEISEPESWSPMFHLEGERAATFVELVHRYQTSYCGERLSA